MPGIGWAVNTMGSGRKVRRQVWPEGVHTYIKEKEMRILNLETDCAWDPMAEDVLAQDWESAPNQETVKVGAVF